MQLAVDCSNYTSQLRAGDVQCWKANGVERVIVQAINPPKGYPPTETVQQIQACAEANVRTDAYVFLWWSLPLSVIQGNLGLLRGYNIGRIWLDVEAEDMNASDNAASLAAKIAAALDLLDGWPAAESPGIYTGKWWWDRHMEQSQEFSGRALWAAVYDGVPDLNQWTPFGGWRTLALKQYRGTTSLCGISGIDLSVIGSDTIPTPPEVTTPDMIRVGQGMKAQMDAAGDAPLAYHTYDHPNDDDNQPYEVERCYGAKGLYISSNASGQWVNAGPI